HPLADSHSNPNVGFRCIIASTRRVPPISLEPRIKTHNYLNNIVARLEAIAAGVDEPIMLDINNCVAETPARNIFLVRDATVYTPREHHILAGITRQVVIELSTANGWTVVVTDLTPYDLLTADEVFVCSTALGIRAVLEINGQQVSDGRIGSYTE